MTWSPHPRTDAWADAMVELEVLVPEHVHADACAVCGREPAVPVRFSALEGYLVAFRVRRLARRLCRSCTIGAFREHQSRTWKRGFWGVPALVIAPFVLLANLRRVRRGLADLSDPRPTAAGVEPGLRGRPVWTRPGSYLPLVVAVVVGLVAYDVLTTRVSVDELAVGRCFDAPAGTTFGPGTGDVIVEPVACLEPHRHQVALRRRLDAPREALYPGLLELDEQAFGECLAGGLEEAVDRSLGVLYPTPRSWERGDRTVTCIVSSRTGPVVGSFID